MEPTGIEMRIHVIGLDAVAFYCGFNLLLCTHSNLRSLRGSVGFLFLLSCAPFNIKVSYTETSFLSLHLVGFAGFVDGPFFVH